jgi:hypothetical protein
MSNTTPKRGRPAKSTATEVASPTKSFKIKREEKVPTAVEYRSRTGGNTLLLNTRGILHWDEEMGYNREMRYCAAEKSIFKDEQSPNAVKSPIVFRLGVLLTRDRDVLLRDFLDRHPENEANGGTGFYKVKSNKEQVGVDIKKEFAVMDAIGLLREKALDDLLSVAISFSIDIDRSVDEIKYDLLQKAKKSPRTFIEAFDNPVVQMKAKIKQAESLNIIKLSEDAVKWFDTNKLIVSVPAGMDPMDVFVRYCLTEAAAPTVAEMERQLQS